MFEVRKNVSMKFLCSKKKKKIEVREKCFYEPVVTTLRIINILYINIYRSRMRWKPVVLSWSILNTFFTIIISN